VVLTCAVALKDVCYVASGKDNVIFGHGNYWMQAVSDFSSPQEALSHSSVAL